MDLVHAVLTRDILQPAHAYLDLNEQMIADSRTPRAWLSPSSRRSPVARQSGGVLEFRAVKVKPARRGDSGDAPIN
jgi:hypothetical protein